MPQRCTLILPPLLIFCSFCSSAIAASFNPCDRASGDYDEAICEEYGGMETIGVIGQRPVYESPVYTPPRRTYSPGYSDNDGGSSSGSSGSSSSDVTDAEQCNSEVDVSEVDAIVKRCQNTYEIYNAFAGPVLCGIVTFNPLLKPVVKKSQSVQLIAGGVCGAGMVGLNHSAKDWCEYQGDKLKENICQ